MTITIEIIKEALEEVLKKTFSEKEITEDTNLYIDLSMSEIDKTELVLALEDKTNLMIPYEEEESWVKVKDILNTLNKLNK
jgi:acyl carrier protein